MKKIYFKIALGVLSFVLSQSNVVAQSLPVGTPVLDDYYRRMQLLGKVDSTMSFTIRPVSPQHVSNIYNPDSLETSDNWVSSGPVRFAKNKGVFQILPVTIMQQFNSNHPYGWNDGAMIPAKGYQTLISGGFYFKLGPLSIQFRPEYVYANNADFDGYASGHNDDELKTYAAYLGDRIDLPERFGNGTYSKLFWGQSNISLTAGPIAVSLSNENIWWGPGIHNSLILSNNAPGFKHVSLHTVRPLNTYIGSFELQIIGGRLDASGFSPLLTTTTSTGMSLYKAKPKDWRYFSAFNINYHPKFIPGFTVGLTRTFDAYSRDVKGFSGYVPFFVPYAKKNIINGDPFARDQYTSFYSRWVLAKAQAEIYFEYGLNDNSYNTRDFIGSPDHSRAYIFGVRKMLPLKTTGNNILIGVEVTQLAESADRLTRPAGTWYIHGEVFDGQTQQGQVLGAGTGPGGNLQNFNISWVSGLKKLGFSFERYEHSVDFSRVAFADIDGNSRKWVDLALGLHGEWNYKNLLFNAKLQHIKSLNYQWVLKNYTAGQYYIPNNTVYNFHGELGVSFRF